MRRVGWNIPCMAVAAAATLLAAAGTAGPAYAEEEPELLWSFQGIENIVCIASIQDIDGDGGADVVVESYDAGAPQTDHLFCLRGASSGTAEVIWSTRPIGGASSGGGYGDNCLRVSPDITGDGVQDVLLGTAWGGRSAYVLSGTDAEQWWMFDTYNDSPPDPPESGWVYAIDAVGDVTGDGVPEVTFCAGNYNRGIYLMDGADGSLLWFYRGQGPFYDVRNIGDVDGDGYDDVVATSGDESKRLVCLSGVGEGGGTPHVIWNIYPYFDTVFSLRPFPPLALGEGNEVIAACWDHHVYCHDGATGSILWQSPDLGTVVQRVSVVGDVNGDGTADVIAGMWTNKVVMLDGTDGSILWTQWVGTLNGGDTWAVDRLGDVTGDGIPDVAVGSFDYYIYAMDGTDGTILWRYYTGNRLLTIRGVPDLNGNGFPDVVGGTQMLYGGDGGIVYALEGAPGAQAAPEITPASDTFSAWPNPVRAAGFINWRLAAISSAEARVDLIDAEGRLLATASGESGRIALENIRAHGGALWLVASRGGKRIGAQQIVIVR